MVLFFLMPILSALGSSAFLHEYVANLKGPFHKLCLSHLPSPPGHALESLICGERIQDPNLQDILIQSGLLHLFVVSGSHLIWLDMIASTLRAPLFLRGLLWFSFALACGWQPPIVRGALGLSLSRALPHLRTDHLVLATGLITLCLFPEWGTSLSLALSWTAALAMTWPQDPTWQGSLQRNTLIWAMIAPLMLAWSVPSPLTVFSNLLMAPVFSALLFPIGILSIAIPPFLYVFDSLFAAFIATLKIFPFKTGAAPDLRITPLMIWLWITLLHLAFHALTTEKRRRLK